MKPAIIATNKKHLKELIKDEISVNNKQSKKLKL
jgi:hypothetical protein